MSKMGELYTFVEDENGRRIRYDLSSDPMALMIRRSTTPPDSQKAFNPDHVRTYWNAIKKLTDEVGKFFMHYKLSLDLDETAPSPDSIRVFMEKHYGSRDVLASKISGARVQCKFAFENVRFWTKQLGQPLTEQDSDGKTLLNMLCVIGRDGIWDMETARLRRERFRAVAKRQLAKSDFAIEFLSPYDLEEEFGAYLAARKKRLERAKNRG